MTGIDISRVGIISNLLILLLIVDPSNIILDEKKIHREYSRILSMPYRPPPLEGDY